VPHPERSGHVVPAAARVLLYLEQGGGRFCRRHRDRAGAAAYRRRLQGAGLGGGDRGHEPPRDHPHLRRPPLRPCHGRRFRHHFAHRAQARRCCLRFAASATRRVSCSSGGPRHASGRGGQPELDLRSAGGYSTPEPKTGVSVYFLVLLLEISCKGACVAAEDSVNPRTEAVAVGIDVGSTTVKAVVVDPVTKEILWSDYLRHQTKQAEFVLSFLERIGAAFPNLRNEQIRTFITGSGGAPIGPHLGSKFVQEVNAVTLAVETLHPDVGSVCELGGQDAKIIIF